MRIGRIVQTVALLGMVAGLLVGCEGAITGTEVARVALQPAASGERGAYAPVKFTLSPEMNPVAFNLRADFSQEAVEFGKWNAYRAVLTQNGATVITPSVCAYGDATQVPQLFDVIKALMATPTAPTRAPNSRNWSAPIRNTTSASASASERAGATDCT